MYVCVYTYRNKEKFKTGYLVIWGFPDGSGSKVSAHNVGDLGSIPGLGKSPGEGTDYPLQSSGLEKIPQTEEAGSLQFKESDTQRVGYD